MASVSRYFGHSSAISLEVAADTSDGFKNALTKLKTDSKDSLKGLVIDLRQDPGGLLNAAVDVAGNLLDGGTVAWKAAGNPVE